jgi:hypothetical protein
MRHDSPIKTTICTLGLCVLVLSGCRTDQLFLHSGSTQGTVLPVPELPTVEASTSQNASADEGTHANSLSQGSPESSPSIESSTSSPPLAPGDIAAEDTGPHLQPVWGIAGIRGYPYGEAVAANGVEFHQLFSLDLDFNLWLLPPERLYLYFDTRFWGQKPAAGVTNANQGMFDFSKREFDFNLGTAWNYWGALEGRIFAYSFNNLNRGSSLVSPSGYADGIGIENRYYLSRTYNDLGTDAYDPARATFVSLGYFPSKDLVDGRGVHFKPGAFARAYLIWPFLQEKWYLYLDAEIITERSFSAKLLNLDSGAAVRPWARYPNLELRFGTDDTYDLRFDDWETSIYGAIRVIF